MAVKIMIIDNDVEFNEACRNFLQATGYEVVYLESEQDAVKQVEQYRPDLILLDICIDTKLGGFDIATKLNADEKLRMTPVIFLTGYFMKSGLLENEKEITRKWPNVAKVIDKPVKPKTLLRAIEQVIR